VKIKGPDTSLLGLASHSDVTKEETPESCEKLAGASLSPEKSEEVWIALSGPN
jgi:hypothetical protein